MADDCRVMPPSRRRIGALVGVIAVACSLIVGDGAPAGTAGRVSAGAAGLETSPRSARLLGDAAGPGEPNAGADSSAAVADSSAAVADSSAAVAESSAAVADSSAAVADSSAAVALAGAWADGDAWSDGDAWADADAWPDGDTWADGDATAPASDTSAAGGDDSTGAISLPAGVVPAAARPDEAAGPSAMYEDAMAHAADRIAFTPGGRVTVAYRPRPDDKWAVGGDVPAALPAGRLSGRQMAAPKDGPAPGSDPPTPEPGLSGVDEPQAAGPPVPARTLSFVARQSIETPPAPDATGLRREVYGFLPYWEVGDSSTRLDYSVLSHIAYFSVGADAAGNLLKRDRDGTPTTGWGGWTSQRMTQVINAAHARRTRVTLTISVFGWTTRQMARQKALLGSPAARRNLARQAVAAVRNRGADGINLDFEPLASGYEDEFVALIRTIRAQFNRIHKGYHLTFDTLGMPGNYPLEAAVARGGADAILIMGYDYRTASSGNAGSVDPLSGPAYDLGDTVQRYLARVPASRVILGIPYYGRAWSTVSSAVNARTQGGPKYGYSASITYENAVELAARYGRRWDSREQSAWFAYRRQSCSRAYGCQTTWRQAYFDDATALGLRYDLVNRSGLRGAGIWALGYEGTRRELNRLLARKFLRDTTTPLAGIRVLPATVVNESFTVRWRATDDWSGVASYDVQVSTAGGPWRTWKSATTSTSDVWIGHDGVAYAFRVRARDRKGNLSAWDRAAPRARPTLRVGAFARTTVDGLAMRSTARRSGPRTATLERGRLVAIVRGPVVADGYTWYEVQGPLADWRPLGPVRDGWVAASGGGERYLVPVRAPNATLVAAGIRGLSFGDTGATSLGPAGAAARVFSPDGDGSRDRLVIRWTNRARLDRLVLRILRPDGKVLGSVALPDVAAGAQAYGWNGKAGGRALPDGSYILQLVGRRGTATYSAPASSPTAPALAARYAVRIDTAAPLLRAATISRASFSPDGDGRLETVTISGSASGGAAGWKLTVSPLSGPRAGTTIRTIARGGTSANASWNGRDDAGKGVADGSYRATLAFHDAAGNVVGRSWSVVVDRRDPVVALATSPASISPDGDGTGETALFRWTADETVSGSLVVLRGSRQVARWWFSPRTAGSTTWTGRDAAGRQLADGRYTLRVELRDAAGNATVRTVRVTIDRTATALRWQAAGFFPQDGDTLAAGARVSFRLARPATTRLRIVDAAGRLVRTAWTSRVHGAGTVGWTWNGRRGGGAIAARGPYTAELTATSALGTTVLRSPIVADAFVASAPASIAAGSRLVITFRSVEPLGGKPRVVLAQAGRRVVALGVTKLADGRWRATVRVATGAPGAAVVTIRARDSKGGTNAMTLGVMVR